MINLLFTRTYNLQRRVTSVVKSHCTQSRTSGHLRHVSRCDSNTSSCSPTSTLTIDPAVMLAPSAAKACCVSLTRVSQPSSKLSRFSDDTQEMPETAVPTPCLRTSCIEGMGNHSPTYL
uniref:Uncharacterized protein n=1 Tax=Ixodes ricinus TaxID=34613 RepID=A0A0K8RDJ8_IXORI